MPANRPVLIGVDTSTEAAAAAVFGQRLAEAAHAPYQFIHAMPDPGVAVAGAALPISAEEYRAALVHQARDEVLTALRAAKLAPTTEQVIVRCGKPADVLQQTAVDLDADLVVLGGKHHATLPRWFGGRTVRDAVRLLTVPLLVTRDAPARLRRILVAVDGSSTTAATFAAAERFARLFGATLRVVYVVEPTPALLESRFPYPAAFAALRKQRLADVVWPRARELGAETAIRHGTAVDALAHEAAATRADLLVVGSHRKGWVDRLAIGSVTEGLLDQLPTSLLVAPMASPPAVRATSHEAVAGTVG